MSSFIKKVHIVDFPFFQDLEDRLKTRLGELLVVQQDLEQKELGQAGEGERYEEETSKHLDAAQEKNRRLLAANSEKVAILRQQMSQIRTTLDGFQQELESLNLMKARLLQELAQGQQAGDSDEDQDARAVDAEWTELQEKISSEINLAKERKDKNQAGQDPEETQARGDVDPPIEGKRQEELDLRREAEVREAACVKLEAEEATLKEDVSANQKNLKSVEGTFQSTTKKYQVCATLPSIPCSDSHQFSP